MCVAGLAGGCADGLDCGDGVSGGGFAGETGWVESQGLAAMGMEIGVWGLGFGF